MNFTDLALIVTTSADNFPLQPSLWATANWMGKKLLSTLVTLPIEIFTDVFTDIFADADKVL
jgi:hypothetical protein